MEIVPCVSAGRAPGRHGRPSGGGGTLCGSRQGAGRYQADAAQHPEDRIYTVMSGVFYIGLGETFDADKARAYPPGRVIVLPGETWHFHWAKSGEYVTQVSAIGPLGIEYHELDDDPRAQSAQAAGRRV